MRDAPRSYIAALCLLLICLPLAACQSTPKPAEIQASEAWGRPSPMSATVGVFYLKITNSGGQDDKLLSVESQACRVIELHETVMEGDTMGMRPVPEGFVLIPAGETVEFKTGGLHLMCIDKQADFSPGTKLPLTLQFENSGAIELEAEIRNP